MSRKLRDLGGWSLALASIVLINVAAAALFVRLDLTEDQRFTLNPATRRLLEGLDRTVYVEVYLEGEFPAGFGRLRQAIREKLDEFRVWSGSNFQYAFVDPAAATNAADRAEYYQQLAERGIQPTRLFDNEGGKRTEKIIFPGALVQSGDQEQPIIFLRGDQRSANLSPAQRLNRAVEGVEYELASAVKRATQTRRRKVGLIRGHGELGDYETFGLFTALRPYYEVERVDLPNVVNLEGYDAVIVAKPDTAFSEPDKFKLDQFVINGGRAMFLLDAMRIDIERIGPEGAMAFPIELNLLDLLFKWGVRVNGDLVQDLQAASIPMFVGYVGDQPQTQPLPWWYFPLTNTFAEHPITKNLDAVYLRFAGTIDTVRAAGITKTPLMFTSRYSRIRPAPVRVNFNEARLEPQPQQFNAGPQPVAYLLEGTFRSLYTNRLAPKTEEVFEFRAQNLPSKVLVISDGDVVRNDLGRDSSAFPLGFDRVSQLTFANQDLILNALEYMLDEDGVVLARNKEIELRPLDVARLQEERLRWQLLNVVGPLVLLVLFGVGRYAWRKRKYERLRPAATGTAHGA